MRDLSLKGIANFFANVSGDFDVVNSLFDGPISGTVSLRSKLETMARKEVVFAEQECIYEWTAAYQQTWSHVLVRIRLLPALGILSKATLDALKPGWEEGIETTWNGKWACVQSGCLPCRVSFEVKWVGGNAHHTVFVRPGSGQTNMGLWHEDDPGPTAAHEFGHMLGNADEYIEAKCPDRSPVNTGTVMDHNENVIPARLLLDIATAIGTTVVVP
jgi:hypothetical protein